MALVALMGGSDGGSGENPPPLRPEVSSPSVPSPSPPLVAPLAPLPISRFNQLSSSSEMVFHPHLACFLVQPWQAVRCFMHCTRNLRHRSQGGWMVSPLANFSIRAVTSDRCVSDGSSDCAVADRCC